MDCERESRRTLYHQHLLIKLMVIMFLKLLLSLGLFICIAIMLEEGWVVWLFGFYSISTFVGYLMQNPFLYK